MCEYWLLENIQFSLVQFVKRFLHFWNERKDVFAHLYYYCVANIASLYNCIISPLFSCFFSFRQKICFGGHGSSIFTTRFKGHLVPISLQFLNKFVLIEIKNSWNQNFKWYFNIKPQCASRDLTLIVVH